MKIKKIFLVESGLYGKDGKDLTIAFVDEQKAWEYVLRKYKRYSLERRNWQRKKGFRGIIFAKKRWLCITQIRQWI